MAKKKKSTASRCGDLVSFSESKWKSCPVEADGDFADFEGLVELEELDGRDYVLLKGGLEKTGKKKKTKDKKRKREEVDVEPEVEDAPKENPSFEEYKRKKDARKRRKAERELKGNNGDEAVGDDNADVDEGQAPAIDKEADESSTNDDDGLRAEMAPWSQLYVPVEVLRALKDMNFSDPTPIQVASIPAAIRDRLDILGAAATGSGKTLAFGIPLINFIMDEKRINSTPKLHGLILTPTRELAVQIKKHLDDIAKYAKVTTMCLVGGLSVQKQVRILRNIKPDIVVATPGRLWEAIETTKQEHLTSEAIKELKFLVIDEADRMTERGHFEELTKVIDLMRLKDEELNREDILDAIPEDFAEDNPQQELENSSEGLDIENKEEDNDENNVLDEESSDLDEEKEKDIRDMTSDEEDASAMEDNDECPELAPTEQGDDVVDPKPIKITKRFKRQILVFSATLTLLHDIPKRLKFEKTRRRKGTAMSVEGKLQTLMDALGMRVDKAKVIDLTQKGSGRPNQEYLKEACITCRKEEKDLYLYYFLSLFPGRSIVFCNSKDCVRRLVNVFRILQLNPLVLHAGIEQKKRLSALEKFSAEPGKGLLIASDVAARGLDISDVDHVIHYQCPRTSECYIHRSGRTARAQTKGVTLVFVEPKEGVSYSKLCHSVNEGNYFESFPIEDDVLRLVRERVDLAQRVDILEHRLKKVRVKSDWFRKAAEEMDIDLNEREDLFENEDDNEKRVRERVQLKNMLKSLKHMLKEPLGTRKTLAGLVKKSATLDPKEIGLIGTKTAIEVIEQKKSKSRGPVKFRMPTKSAHPRKEKKPKFAKKRGRK